jgi:hypothetical protein
MRHASPGCAAMVAGAVRHPSPGINTANTMSHQDQLLKALDEPVFEIDAAGVVVFATESMAAWTGRETAYPFADVLAEQDRSRYQQMLARLLDGKTATALLELRLVTTPACCR